MEKTEKTDIDGLLLSIIDKKLTITTAESCTGGMIASAIVDISGVSEIFHEGYVTYSDEAKERILGVDPKIIEGYGVVSAQTAEAMAEGAAKKAGADIALSSTGVAGPDGGTREHPVGEVYLGCYVRGNVRSVRMHGCGDRTAIRRQAVEEAFQLLDQCLGEMT